MKITRNDITVLVVILVVMITGNAYWRVKETGRRARLVAEQEALRDAGADALAE